MADAQRTIDLIFNGVDKTSSATQAVIDNLGSFSSKVTTATQPLADFTLGALKVEGAILAAGTALTLFAVNEAAKFEGALFDLKKVLGDTDGSLESFADAATKISEEYGVASTDVLASVANFKQAGFSGAEALQLVRNALDLKIAGDIDAARSSDLLVASIKGFGLEASSASTVVDLLNEVSNRYATNVDELATGFALLSPVAKAAGLSLEETAGILTPGIEVFRSGSEVANGLRTVLLRLQDDSKPVQETLAALGVAQRDANGELRSARDIYFDVAVAFGGLNDSQKTYYAAQLAGLDQSAKFIAVMDGVGKTLEISGGNFDYLGSAAKEVEVRLASTQSAVEKAQVSFSNLAKAIGAPLLDEFKGVSDAVAQIFQALGVSAKEGGLAELVAYVESVAADIQTAFEQVAKNLPAALDAADLSGFKNGIDAVLSAIKALFGEIDITTTEGLTKAIEFLGKAFFGLSTFTAGVIESFKPLFDLLVKVGDGATKVDADVFKLAGNIGGAATQINLLASGLNGILPSLEALLGLLVLKQGIGLVGALSSTATGATALSAALGTAGLGAAFTVGYQGGTVLKEGIDNLVSSLTGSQTTLGSWIYDLVNSGEKAEQFGVKVGGINMSVDELNKGVESGRFVWNDVTQSWEFASKAASGLATGLDGVEGAVRKVTSGPMTYYINALDEIVKSQITSKAELDKWNAAVLASGGVIDESGRRLNRLGEEIKTTGLVIDKSTGAIVSYYGAFEDLSEADKAAIENQKAFGIEVKNTGDKTKQTTDEIKKAEQATRDYALKLEEIASNERIKNIEASVTLKVADLENETKRVEAAFRSVDSSIESTAKLLGDLFGLLGKGDLGIRDWQTVNKAIEAETKNREEQLKLQNDLVREQIKSMEARREAMERGDSLIQIDGVGLQPHLEAFMWEILQAIQVRVNQDGLDLLLGVQS